VKPRPAGADNFLKWRRTIDEHLELRRMTWDEYAMFSWLCTKAGARTGTLRTSWPTLAQQTGLSSAHVEVLCRGLKRKCYIWYPKHRGQRRKLVEVAIHKFPLPGDRYTDLRARFEEVPLELSLEVPSELPLEVTPKTGGNPPTSPSGRTRKRSRKEEALRVRSADPGSPPERIAETEASRRAAARGAANDPETTPALTLAEAIRQVPAVLRETLELYGFKTSRQRVDAGDLDDLRRLGEAHTPAVIQKALTEAVSRFVRRGDDPAAVTWAYVRASLQHFNTRTRPRTSARPAPVRRYPPGVTQLE
jgi:hypothetical protein